MRKSKKKNIKIILVILLLGITLGYSLLSSNLNISGTTGLSSNTWNIHWSNLSVTNGSVTGTQVTTPATIKTGNTEVEYSITLSTPGEFYEFTVDAVNKGSIDAMIESFSNKTYESNGTTEKALPTYLNYSVTYSDGIALAQKQKLAANTTEKLKVRVEFKRDIEANQLPTEVDTIVFKFNVTYVQADNNSIEVYHPYTGTIYRWSTIKLANVNTSGADNYPTTITDLTKGIDYITENDYPTYSARVTILGKQNYLKHVIDNDNIVETYVCFVANQEYCMKGMDSMFRDANEQLVDYYQEYYQLSRVSWPSESNHGCSWDNYAKYCYGPNLGEIHCSFFGSASITSPDGKQSRIDYDGISYCVDN